MPPPQTVILVHGLWMTGLILGPLAQRLKRCGYRPILFSYHSLRKTIHANAQSLVQTVRLQTGSRVHLVGHSLGGLVILEALSDEPALIDGRIVLLGSPVNGSVVARRLYRHQLSRWLIGRGGEGRLVCGGEDWHGSQQLGVIAGTLPVGVGRTLCRINGPNDGTVAVSETQLEGCTDTLQVGTTHTGLIYSRSAAQATCRFLQSGRFSVSG